MQWFVKTFKELSTEELYQILKLRIDVFVVEQNCVYPDLDDLDKQPGTLHLFAMDDQQLTAYMRIFPPQVNHPSMSSLGRVATDSRYRNIGLGHKLLLKAINIIDKEWPNISCHISAQSHLVNYYNRQGFFQVGEEYLEDGIPHIGMDRLPQGKNSSGV